MKTRCKFALAIALVGSLCLGAANAERGTDTAFTYQGQLKLDGHAITDLTLMRFTLWDAESGGLQLGSACTPPSVDVVDGLFTVQIQTNNFGHGAFNGAPRWLQIAIWDADAVTWVILDPRQPITPVPYAMYAADSPGSGCLWSENGSDIYYSTGDVGVGTTNPSYPLHAISENGETAVAGENPGEATYGYLGHEFAGVYGLGSWAGYFIGRGYFSGDVGVGTTSPSEKLDVVGTVKMTGFQLSNAPSAGHVLTSDASGVGTWQPGDGGSLWSQDGSDIYFDSGNVGIGASSASSALYVYEDGPRALMVDCVSTGTLGDAIYAQTSATLGIGVYGKAAATSGQCAGVHGVAFSPNGRGVVGYNGSYSGDCVGVLGRSTSPSGYAVRGEAIGTSSVNYGVYGETSSPSGYGVYGVAPGNGKGVAGFSGGGEGYLGWNGGGIYGTSVDGYGVKGHSTNDWAIFGQVPAGSTQAGVVGAITLSNGAIQWVPESGVCGSSEDGYGVSGRVDGGMAIYGTHDDTGNFGYLATPTEGAYGEHDATGNFGQLGTATAGVHGESSVSGDYAVYGLHTATDSDDPAIYGKHAVTDCCGVGVSGVGGYCGVEGFVSPTGTSSYLGVLGFVSGGSGTNYGVYGWASGGAINYAGYFSGDLRCTGTLSKGGGSFMIDHPLDPENKYLYHSFVESPDMMNIYNGNVVTDKDGYATVEMPEWFEALNMEFRYQLTVIDAADSDSFVMAKVVRKIAGNQFTVRTSEPNAELSWQVTGVRQDAFANANRVQVEVDKPEDERGTYIHPEAFGLSADLQVDKVREAKRAALVADKD